MTANRVMGLDLLLPTSYFLGVFVAGAEELGSHFVRSGNGSICQSPPKPAVDIPDVAILIDADPAVTIQRIAVGRGDTPNHFERVDELEKVREIFLELAKTDDVIRVIDGNQSIQAVYRATVEVVVHGVLKQKRCAKDYDCDYIFCAPRLAGQCRWAEIAPELLGTTTRPTALIK